MAPWPAAARSSSHIECGFHLCPQCTESWVATIPKLPPPDVLIPMISLFPATAARDLWRALPRRFPSGDDCQCISLKSECRPPPCLQECRSQLLWEIDASLPAVATCLLRQEQTVRANKPLRRLIVRGQNLV